MPKTSVIITSYNVSNFIHECLLSIFKQSVMPDEIILCDDASTDDTIEKVKNFSSLINIIQQDKNCGALINTYSGFKAATGDVVFFIDGDDTWPTNKIERIILEYVNDDELIICSHNHRRVNELGVPTGVIDDTHKNIANINKSKFSYQVKSDLYRNSILNRKGYWFGSAYSIRRNAFNFKLFDSILIREPVLSKYSYFDLVGSPFLVATNPSGKIGYIDDVVFDYRVHSAGSAYSNSLDKLKLSILRVSSTNTLTIFFLKSLNIDVSKYKGLFDISNYYELLSCVYFSEKSFFYKIRLFYKNLPYLRGNKIILKELARLFVVHFVGYNFFFSLKR